MNQSVKEMVILCVTVVIMFALVGLFFVIMYRNACEYEKSLIEQGYEKVQVPTSYMTVWRKESNGTTSEPDKKTAEK